MRKPITKATKSVQKIRQVCPICNLVIPPADNHVLVYKFSDGGSAAIHCKELFSLFSRHRNLFPELTLTRDFDLISYLNRARGMAIKNNNAEKLVGVVTSFLDEVKVKNNNFSSVLSLTSYYGGFNEYLEHGLVLRSRKTEESF